MSLDRIKLSSAVLAILTFITILGHTNMMARAGANICYPEFDAKTNSWDEIRNCQNSNAVAEVALRLQGEKEIDANTLVNLFFLSDYRRFDFVSGKPIPDDPILFAKAVPKCMRFGGYRCLGTCDVRYYPETGQKMDSSSVAVFKVDWDCLQEYPDMPSEEEPKAIPLIDFNQRKLDRIVAKARRAALADCPSIWSTLVQAGIKTKSCDQLK